MSNATTQRRLSSRNPFRTPSLTPNPTGTSTTSTVPSYHSALPISHTLLIPTPTGMSTTSNAPSYHTAVESNVHSNDEDTPEILPELTPGILSRNLSDLTLDDIPEVPPPAYTLTPDIDGGEASMQDPIEPFQPAPEPPVQLPPPPPSPPSSFHERPLSPLSEFEVPPSPTTPLQQQQPHYAPPPGPPPPTASVRQQPRYGPPPGAPPLDRPRAASTSSSAGSTSPPASNGHPTSIPTPGRPLLRNGRTLIYPESFLCHKCQNTGYKNYDPSHPCRKCWDRFGKPFTSILASSPWGDQSSSSASQNGRTFQRPLPSSNTSPQRPVAAPVHPTPPPPPPPPRVSPRIPQQQQRPPPPPGMFVPHRMPPPPPPPPPGMFVPHSMPPPRTGPAIMPYGGVPPPGAAVVMPGDSRIGGTLCLRCGGRGTTSFLIFDEMTCESCGGIGRLLNRPPQNCSWNKQGMDPLAGPQGINGWSRRF